MAIEKNNIAPELNEDDMVLEIELAAPGTFEAMDRDMPDGIEIEESEDGGVVVDFEPMSSRGADEGDFGRNLAEDMEAAELGALASQLVDEYENNKASRSDWEDAYSKGLDLLAEGLVREGGMAYDGELEPYEATQEVVNALGEDEEAVLAKELAARARLGLVQDHALVVEVAVLGVPRHARGTLGIGWVRRRHRGRRPLVQRPDAGRGHVRAVGQEEADGQVEAAL